ncbi:TolC family protein [Parahaliea maris]|nr:TolC family protein [Parahaliea maris]
MTPDDLAPRAEHALQKKSRWQYTQQNAESVVRLTDLIDIPDVIKLVTRSLVSNPGLQQVRLSMMKAHAARVRADSASVPGVSLGIYKQRQDRQESNYLSTLNVSWEIDIWQKLADSSRAAQLDVVSSEASYRAARNALAAAVIRAWLESVLNARLIDIQTQRLNVLVANEDLITMRYRSGLGDLQSLDDARTASANGRAVLVEYKESLQRSLRALAILTGERYTDLSISLPEDFPNVLLALSTVPEQDLALRPDLQQAYADIAAADYRVNVAFKNLLPSLSLTGTYGDTGRDLGDVLFDSSAWSLLAGITGPIFNGGQLSSDLETAELTAEQALWAYQERLLTAVQEVNDALGSEQSLQGQLQHVEQALLFAERSLINYQQKYRNGLVDILDLLLVQQTAFNLQERRAQLRFQRLSNRVDLGLALGLAASE